LGKGKIQHVVIIIQENRSVDDLFNGLPGADTVREGKNTQGKYVVLQPVLLTAPYDLDHKHIGWVGDYDNGKMDGFNTETVHCKKKAKCPPTGTAAYGYVPRTEVEPYWTMAEQYAFGDNTFQTNQGPSFPAHQYLVSGTSTIKTGSDLRAEDNPGDPVHKGRQGGCDSVKSATVNTIYDTGQPGPHVFPCFNRLSIMDLMNARGISWRYYQARGGSGFWNAPDAIKKIRYGPSYTNVIWPPKRALTDIAQGKLAQVTFITPSVPESDHASHTNGTGPDWVGNVVNAIGESQFWQNTAIFVTWDDWGGWFDHVKPVVYNPYELGFRVPLIVIGPYVRPSYVSHKQHEFGSMLKFSEEVFNLPSLGTTDVRADDLKDCFNFSQRPRKFKPIPTRHGPQYFLREPVDNESPDDDF
jgi:phospholipase C